MSKLKQSLRSSSSFPSFLFALPFSRPLKAQKARPWLSQEPLTVAPASRCNLSPTTPRCSGCCARERDKGHRAPLSKKLQRPPIGLRGSHAVPEPHIDLIEDAGPRSFRFAETFPSAPALLRGMWRHIPLKYVSKNS